MTAAEHEVLIDRHERLMLEANNRADRELHYRARRRREAKKGRP